MKKPYKILISAGIVAMLAIIGCWIIYIYLPARRQSSVIATDLIKTEKPVTRLFGIAVDSFNIETGRVQRNQTLGKILERFNLPPRSLSQLLVYGSRVFDLRKIRRGNGYTAFLSRDTLYRLQYLVYEHSPLDYVVYDFTDSLKVFIRHKEIKTIKKSVQGKIETSLWDAITKNNINPLVALELSDIYAWTIDFFGLQPSDSFSVVYDELYVDTTSIGLGKIYGAYFRHVGTGIYAIPFVQDSVESYYDADGNSLRRAFLKAPLRYSRISSRFSNSRFHPILKIYRPHHGVDYSAPIGTPVYSIGDGRVIEATMSGGAGRIVKVRHNSIYTTSYMHLSNFGKGIHAGVYVKQGDLLGYVGSSGLSTGPHLDFRVYKYGTAVDPLKLESPPVDPVKPYNRAAFDSVKSVTLKILDNAGGSY